MEAMYVAQEATQLDTEVKAYGLKDSFISEARMQEEELSEVIRSWINVEDEEETIKEILDEEGLNLEKDLHGFQHAQEEEEDDDNDPIGLESANDDYNDDEVQMISQLSELKISSHLKCFREFARKEGVEEHDILLLTRFECALRNARLKKTRYQRSITSYFKKT
jgi:hypothetical protein